MSAEARAAVVDPRNRSQRWSARGVEDVLARRGRDAGCSPPPARRATPTAGPAVRAFATGPTAGARRGIDNGNQVFNKSRRSVRIARRLAGGKGSGNEGGARAASRRRLPWTAVREATEGASRPNGHETRRAEVGKRHLLREERCLLFQRICTFLLYVDHSMHIVQLQHTTYVAVYLWTDTGRTVFSVET